MRPGTPASMHACRQALVKPFSGRPRLVQWNTQGMMLPVLRWIFSVAVLQAIADRLNDHGNPAWITPRDMIHGLLNGDPLRRTLANYISADRRWRWLKRCTVCGIWFPTVRGERCSRVCTDQWWSRARRNSLPSARVRKSLRQAGKGARARGQALSLTPSPTAVQIWKRDPGSRDQAARRPLGGQIL